MLDLEMKKKQKFTVNKPRGATSINPATLLYSEVAYQPEEEAEWEFISDGHSQLMGITTKSFEYTANNGNIYVYPVGATVLLTALTGRGPNKDRYTAGFIGEGILKHSRPHSSRQRSTQRRTHRSTHRRTQSGGKRRSTKNRRRRSRSTRRNKHR